MRHQTLKLCWWEGEIRRSAWVRPLDIRVREGAEYLKVHPARSTGKVLEIRLDRIISSEVKEP